MVKRNALLSVFDKTGIVEFGKELVELGFTLYSSGGTAKKLAEGGVPVTDVAELVGFPPILDHRVVTLHPKVHGGLLAVPSIVKHMQELEEYGIPFIDLVYYNFYPLAEAINKPDASRESVIEQTDIGGPAAARSGAKGRRIVMVHPSQIGPVLDWLKAGEPDGEQFREKLAARAEAEAAGYALASAQFISGGSVNGVVGERSLELAYGENRWQTPAGYYSTVSEDPLGIDKFRQVEGGAPSFNNVGDIERLLQTVTHIAAGFDVNFRHIPYIAVAVKHGNACGAAVSTGRSGAIEKMVLGDPRALFGGLVMTNFEITGEHAEMLLTLGGSRVLDGVIAPAFAQEAIDRLARRKTDKCRLLVNPALRELSAASLDTAPRLTYARGGFTVQPNYTFVLNRDVVEVKCGEVQTRRWENLVLAWAVGSTSHSNTITLVRKGQLLGNGVGQQDRVGAAELALKRASDAGHAEWDLEAQSEGDARVVYWFEGEADVVAYSDSFFPFPDAPQVLVDAGVKAILTSSGSKAGDPKTIDVCQKEGVALVMVPDVVGRGFRH